MTTYDAALEASPNGQHLLLSASGGNRFITPGSANTTLPTSGAQAEFLPNGDSIINEGNNYLAYQFASGATGALIQQHGGVFSYAANAHELLVITSATNNPNALGAASYTIGADGSLTANGPVITFFTGVTMGYSAVGLDPNGEADVMLLDYTNQYDDQSPVEVRRLNQNGAATWQQPNPLVPSINGYKFVAAPGGRMLATWTDYLQNDAGNSEPHLFASVREPGQAFGPVQTLLSRTVASGQSADVLGPSAAAGPDGTLALVAQTEDCPDKNASTVATSVATVWVSSPGGNGGLNAQPIGSTTATATHLSSITALAAGHGEALVGIHDMDVTSDPAGDYVSGSCGQPADSGEVSGSYTNRALLTGSGDHVLGNGTWETNVSCGSGCTHNITNDVFTSNASLDANGYATVDGSLDTPNAVQFATYGPVGTISTPPTSTATASPAPSSPTTSAPGTPTSTPNPNTGNVLPLPQATTKPLPQKAATITTAPSGAVTNAGVQTITVTNTTTGVEDLTLAEYASASGLTTAAPHVITGKAPKLVLVSSTRVRLRPHQPLKIHLKLTAAAKRALRQKHHLSVTLKLTSTEHGYATKSTLRHINLKQS